MPVQPLFSCAAVLTFISLLAAPAAAEPHRATISESARQEAARLASAESTVPLMPPQRYRSPAGPVPNSRLGRKIVAATAGATGGLFGGALIGVGVARLSGCTQECELAGIVIGAPVGAVTGAVVAALLTR